MNITKKLFFTLFGIAIFIELLNFGLARWSFEQGLKEFVGGLEQQRLQAVSAQLINEYTISGENWDTFKTIKLGDFLKNNPWQSQRSLTEPSRPPNDSTHPDKPRENAHPPHRRGPPHPHKPPHPRSQNHRTHTGPPIALYDVNGHIIAGETIDTDQERVDFTIMHNGVMIGELRSWLIVRSGPVLATQFSRQQLTASVIIGVVCLLIAGMISWQVSLRLLRPVREILTGVSKLSDGYYNVEFTHKRKDEFGQLMQDIASLSCTLDKNRSAKNRWFANISHELRTPLTVLHGEIEVVKAGIRPLDMSQLKSFEQEVNLLRRLVDDLYQLSLSDVGGLRYQLELLNLSRCLEATVDEMRVLASTKNIAIDLAVKHDIMIMGDQQRLEQLVLNLCTNALEYTDQGGKVAISLTNDIKDNSKILLTFNDTEPGLTPEECQMMFDPLYRHDSSRTMRESGAGLGLTICKNIVEAHQGKIWATPSALGGVCVFIELNSTEEMHQ